MMAGKNSLLNEYVREGRKKEEKQIEEIHDVMSTNCKAGDEKTCPLNCGIMNKSNQQVIAIFLFSISDILQCTRSASNSDGSATHLDCRRVSGDTGGTFIASSRCFEGWLLSPSRGCAGLVFI